jgi:hypothetical protein
MDLLFYLFGNWMCIGGGCMLLQAQQQHQAKRADWEVEPSGKELMISRDLLIMLLIGSVSRIYWSFSPPAVWSEEIEFIQYLSIVDTMVSPALWAVVVGYVALKARKYANSPWFCQWPFLTLVSFIGGYIGACCLPPMDVPESFLWADVIVMWNMVQEGVAMIPQLYLVATTNEKITTEATHFVGLLSLARVFRMIFWAVLILAPIFGGHDTGHYIWAFIVPDVVHTIIMWDYLYIWLKKVRRDNFDPYLSINV